MAVTSRRKTKVHRLKLEGEMSIYNAVETKERLMTALQQHQETEIDLAKVTEMDSAGFQLLLLAKREAAAQDKTLRLVNHSDATLDIINLYHMAGHLDDPIVLKRKGK